MSRSLPRRCSDASLIEAIAADGFVLCHHVSEIKLSPKKLFAVKAGTARNIGVEGKHVHKKAGPE